MRTFRVKVNGSEYEVEIEEINPRGGVSIPSPVSPAAPEKPKTPAAPAPAVKAAPQSNQESGSGIITAQMPGTIVNILVGKGDQVTKGQTLVILEAMKMENEIVAPQDGVIGTIAVAKGASVNAGDTLVILN